jgi:dTDP-4-dehydrorhamnose 3,5-epimerase
MRLLNVSNTPLNGLTLVQRHQVGDHRGYLQRLFCAEFLKQAGWHAPIMQINHTFTCLSGTVRGLHFQYAPYTEMKLVTCLKGAVWDLAVDLRHGSPTFLHWHAEKLSADNQRSLMIPEGFAHGFQTLSDDVEMLYFHSQSYMPAMEGGVHPQDPRLAINWPLPIKKLSDRDASHKLIDNNFEGVVL